MKHREVQKLANSSEGVDIEVLLNDQLRTIDGQRKHIGRLEAEVARLMPPHNMSDHDKWVDSVKAHTATLQENERLRADVVRLREALAECDDVCNSWCAAYTKLRDERAAANSDVGRT